MNQNPDLDEVLFREHLHQVYCRRDRAFAWLMGAQWLFAIFVALVLSPYAWAGKVHTTHLHLYYAILVGGALSLPTILLAIYRPGWVVTRHWVAITQMLWSALLIHLTGGRIETHFHVFGSLAFIAFYRDWRVLVTATVVVAADHLIRGIIWPESVYGVTNPEWWRFLEHAFWVVFENVVLVMGIVESHGEMRALAARQTDLEERVAKRTTEVVAAKREVSDILDHMGDAIFTVGEDGKISREFSAPCRTLFRTGFIAHRSVLQLLDLERPGVSEPRSRLEGFLSTVIGADDLQWTLSEGDAPAELEIDGRIVEITYAPIYRDSVVHRVMFVCRDVTRVRELAVEVERKGEQNRSMLERIAQIAAIEPRILTTFLDESVGLLSTVRESVHEPTTEESLQRARRALHTLKGNSRAYGMVALSQAVHDAERELRPAQLAVIEELFGEFERLGREVIARRSSTGIHDASRLEPIMGAAQRLAAQLDTEFAGVGADERRRLRELLDALIELPLVPFSTLLPRLEGVAKDVAAQVGKPAPELQTSLDGWLAEAPVLEKLGGVLTQLVRNAVDHGLELPEQRTDASKHKRGRLSLAARVAGDQLHLEVGDDGRGLDPDRIRRLALSRRLISENDAAMNDDDAAIALLFQPGFSTATQVTEISGRGVGLDVVRSSIRELGGDVAVRSDAGRGTTFMLSLPLSCARLARSVA